jgi:hypothetical protein
MFVQALADGDEQFGDEHTVMKALTFPQPPVGLADLPLITVPERFPDDAPEGQLPSACAQLGHRGRQQFVP